MFPQLLSSINIRRQTEVLTLYHQQALCCCLTVSPWCPLKGFHCLPSLAFSLTCLLLPYQYRITKEMKFLSITDFFCFLLQLPFSSTKSKQDIFRSPFHLRHCLAPLPACQAAPTPSPLQVAKCRVHHPNSICVIAFNIPVGLWMGFYLHCLCRDAVLLLYFFCHLARCCHLPQALSMLPPLWEDHFWGSMAHGWAVALWCIFWSTSNMCLLPTWSPISATFLPDSSCCPFL